VVLDIFKGQPFETNFFPGVIMEVQNGQVSIKVREDFWGKFGYGESEEEGMLDEDGVMVMDIHSINEAFVKKTSNPEEDDMEVSFGKQQESENETVEEKKNQQQQKAVEEKESWVIYKPKPDKQEKKKLINSFLENQKKNLLGRIKRQMEYYFGDKNYSTDEFLQKEIAKSKDGSIPLKVFLTFNKIKKMNGTVDLIREALEDSKICVLSKSKTSVKKANS
jgi:hypothetical protein